jgi:hypothetical protein
MTDQPTPPDSGATPPLTRRQLRALWEKENPVTEPVPQPVDDVPGPPVRRRGSAEAAERSA